MDAPQQIEKGKVGGWRPGGGRPLGDSERYRVYLHRDVRVMLMRFAASIGIHMTPRPRRSFWDKVLAELLKDKTPPEPEYLQLLKSGESSPKASPGSRQDA